MWVHTGWKEDSRRKSNVSVKWRSQRQKNRHIILVETKTGHGPYPLGMEYTQGNFRGGKKKNRFAFSMQRKLCLNLKIHLFVH